MITKPSKKTLSKWAEMTDWNHHTAVRADIAKYFGLKHHEEYFNAQLITQRERGFSTLNECKQRCAETSVMLDTIGNIWGEDVRESVNECL